LWLVFIAITAVSCGPRSPQGEGGRMVTVTIPPFAWFVEQIGGDDFTVNVLLPQGADHHIWEPLPVQISSLSASEAFIMNGQLGFEYAWTDRFMQVNPDMKVLDLSRHIELIGAEGLRLESPGQMVSGLKVSGMAVPGLVARRKGMAQVSMQGKAIMMKQKGMVMKVRMQEKGITGMP